MRALGGLVDDAGRRRRPGRPRVRRTGTGLPRARHRARRPPCARPTRPPWRSSTPRRTSPGRANGQRSWPSSAHGFPGLGGHPSLSLHSTVDGTPLLCDEAGSALQDWPAPRSPGSSRCCPSSWPWPPRTPTRTAALGRATGRPRTATWGVGNYSCALRAVADDPRVARLELRIPGADTSPHLCLAMFLGAALWGIEQRLDPPPPVVAPADGRARQPVRPALPRDLVEAADRFEEQRGGPRAVRPRLRRALRRRLAGPRRPPVIASSHSRNGSATCDYA